MDLLFERPHDLAGRCIASGTLKLCEDIGAGATAVVFLAIDLTAPPSRPPVYYAVKCMRKAESRLRLYQARELTLHQQASSHPNVVSVHRIIDEGPHIFVVMDYYPDDLFYRLTMKNIYLHNPRLIKQVFVQLLDAVDFCHRSNIFHRDIKPENILCSPDGRQLFLADFGMGTSEVKSPEFGCGTSHYMSPEACGGVFRSLGTYSSRLSDIWALGIILINLTCARNPWTVAYSTDKVFRRFLENRDLLLDILPITHQMNELLKNMFQLNPAVRLSIAEIKQAVLKIPAFNVLDQCDDEAHGTYPPTDYFSMPPIFHVSPPTTIDHDPYDDCSDFEDDFLGSSKLEVPPPGYSKMPTLSPSSSSSTVSSCVPKTPDMLAFEDLDDSTEKDFELLSLDDPYLGIATKDIILKAKPVDRPTASNKLAKSVEPFRFGLFGSQATGIISSGLAR